MINRSTGPVRRSLSLLAWAIGFFVGQLTSEVQAQYRNFNEAIFAGAGAINARQL